MAQVADIAKRKISQLEFFFVPAEVNVDQVGIYGGAKYRFAVNVINGVYDAEFQGIEVGRYEVYAFASSEYGSWIFKDEKIPLTISAGKISTLSVNFKMSESILLPFKVAVTSGNFKEGGQYKVSLQNPGRPFSENDWAQYRDGSLYFHLWAYQPFTSGQQVIFSITDKSGNVINFAASINIMDFVANNGQDITLKPVAIQSGGVVADIRFAHEAYAVSLSPLDSGLAKYAPVGSFGVDMLVLKFAANKNQVTINEVELSMNSSGYPYGLNTVNIIDLESGVLLARGVLMMFDPNYGQGTFHLFSALAIPASGMKTVAIRTDILPFTSATRGKISVNYLGSRGVDAVTGGVIENKSLINGQAFDVY
ncbi:MAG: hypothetical protein V1801_01180 [Candidatus Falkowbacteria bacterium]